ncbi:hypothetical protein CU097_002699, partial [Rhizopus azygosporus]
VQKWLADGVIEPVPANIDNKRNSPLTLAPKKDIHGNLTGKRPCLDPRHINKYLPDDRYPLPTLDLKSTFHRFKINEDMIVIKQPSLLWMISNICLEDVLL